MPQVRQRATGAVASARGLEAAQKVLRATEGTWMRQQASRTAASSRRKLDYTGGGARPDRA
jgi:hypothetical protein